MWRLRRHPSPPSTEGGDHPRQRMVEDILPRHSNARPNKKGLPSVSLTADSSLCRGSPRSSASCTVSTLKERQPPLSFFHPHAACPRRLVSAAVDSRQAYRRRAPTHRRNQLCRRIAHPERQPLFGREASGRRGASLREAASPQRTPTTRFVSSGRGPEGGELLFREAPLPRIPPRPSLIPSVPPRLGQLEPGT